MNGFLIAILLQSSVSIAPRSALENPSVVFPVPAKVKKDYDKIWIRFLAGKNDAKVVKDLDKMLRKEQTFDAGLTLEGYIALSNGDAVAARQRFTEALRLNSNNRIALYYLAELAYTRQDYAGAVRLYSDLMSIDKARPDIETKRQTALLRATDELLRSAARAEAENRLAEAEQFYRQALSVLPGEPTLHLRLADLLAKEGKNDEAETQRKALEASAPRPALKAPTTETAKGDDLEDLGRWGSDIETFRRIRTAETISREQLAALVVRYFPQITEFSQRPQIVTDIQDSWASSEIQTIVGVGLILPLPNHTFEPAGPVTRGDLAAALARLGRLLKLSPGTTAAVTPPDVGPTNTRYPDVQLVLGYGVMDLENSGSFNVGGYVSGQEAVGSASRLLRSFQQAQR
jgi:tetratricopeptide (TPR) repeat protein